jgi:glycosyltransferase involved in cell wall biosynthesis
MFFDIELVQNPEDVTAMRRLRIPASKLHLLGNGIDLKRFRPITSEARAAARAELGLEDRTVAIGAVSRLVWEKGLRELFAAAVELRESAPEAQILVAGPFDSSKSDGLTPRQVARIAEETGVRFLGEQREIESVYAALDIYVLASHREGFPRSAMEAAASGLPTVATNIRGCRQVVDNEVTGLLVAPGDSISLAASLRRLALDPDLRARMGSAAIAKARREFDQNAAIDVTLEAYRRLLSARGLKAVA